LAIHTARIFYDPETDPSQFMAALWRVRHLCTRAEHVRPTVPGSYILVQAIMSAIDDYAERETGNREYLHRCPAMHPLCGAAAAHAGAK
jgi:hypothetical protein